MTTSEPPPEGKIEAQSKRKVGVDVPTVLGCLSIALGGVSVVLGILSFLSFSFPTSGWVLWLGINSIRTWLAVALTAIGGLILGALGMDVGRRQASEKGYRLSRAGAVLSAVVGVIVLILICMFAYMASRVY